MRDYGSTAVGLDKKEYSHKIHGDSYSQVEIFQYSASTLLLISLFGATPFGLEAKRRPTCGSFY
jgi:hypothetical protein